ncbi:Cse1-domain-containing protein [Flagelloscypha sp. PMI_526]|nr:Cse1-domain-containing protein [Flagelloscypha sp. PMI_526]
MDLSALLVASMNPATRKQAETELQSASVQPGFLTHLLQLVLNSSVDRAARLAGSVYLKNMAKLRWIEEDPPIQEADKATLRDNIVQAMLALSTASDKPIRAQIAEAASLIAELDFPAQWPNLIDQLVGSLSPTDYSVNLGILETSHTIFRQWRHHVRSDSLFTEINLVLSKFMSPFLELFRQTARLLLLNPASIPSTEQHALIAATAVQLNELFYDFCCQDLPPGIEDSHQEFFDPTNGLFHQYMSWNPAQLASDPDDATPSLPSQVKSTIFELVELFIKQYSETLQQSPTVEAFVQEIWGLVGDNRLPGIGDDQLVSHALRLLSTAVRSGYYKQLFSSKETIASIVQGVIVPNVMLREHDAEQFEDDPLEYVRLDLAVSATGTDAATRRQSAGDVLQALVGSGHESETTEIVGSWINQGLAEYQKDKTNNWKAKDTAVYLLISLASRGSTTQHGVTATNSQVDVIKFFGENVFQDLDAVEGSVHPILQVDAIRYILTFRNQLSKEQLLGVLPILARHLSSSNYVTYTYAAITIDKILLIKQDNLPLFSQADVQSFALDLINALLGKIEGAGTAEKVAENDHLMKCVMRVVMTTKSGLVSGFEPLLNRLVVILGVISKNPSNPNFDQYIFETISALMRFVVNGNPVTLPTFENALFGPFTIIIQQDIEQYIPYVFQVLAQMLNLHTDGVPEQYRPLLNLLFSPTAWQQKGSIPGLVKLLKAFLSKDAAQMVAAGQVVSVLAVVQQRLIPSKMNDGWGFELLQSVVRNVQPSTLSSYFKDIVMTLLTRMQTSKTDKYAYQFSYFLLFTMALNIDGLTPDFVLGTVEGIQPGLWLSVLNNIVLPQVPIFLPRDRKVAVGGLTKMLTQSSIMLQEPSVQAWPPSFTALVKLFGEPQHLTAKASDDSDTGFTMIDHEEQTAGYQAAYSRLAASEFPEPDPVAYVTNPVAFVGEQIKSVPRDRLVQLIGACNNVDVQNFVTSQLGL